MSSIENNLVNQNNFFKEGFPPAVFSPRPATLQEVEKPAGKVKKAGQVNIPGLSRLCQKCGLGLALHNIFNVYWERGQHGVTLGASANNLTGAVQLYEKTGMKVVRQGKIDAVGLLPTSELAVTSSEE